MTSPTSSSTTLTSLPDWTIEEQIKNRISPKQLNENKKFIADCLAQAFVKGFFNELKARLSEGSLPTKSSTFKKQILLYQGGSEADSMKCMETYIRHHLTFNNSINALLGYKENEFSYPAAISQHFIDDINDISSKSIEVIKENFSHYKKRLGNDEFRYEIYKETVRYANFKADNILVEVWIGEKAKIDKKEGE